MLALLTASSITRRSLVAVFPAATPLVGGHGICIRRIMTTHLLGTALRRRTLCGSVMSVFQSIKPFAVRSQPSTLLGGGHGSSFRRIMTIHLLGSALSRPILCGTVMLVFQSVKPFVVRSWWCSQPSPPLGDGHGRSFRRIMTIHLLGTALSRPIRCGTVT